MPRSLLLATLLLLCASCATGNPRRSAGVSVARAPRNEVAREFPATPEETWEATLEALDALALPRQERRLDPVKRRIFQGDMIVAMEGSGAGVTRVCVRGGKLPEQGQRTERLLDEIWVSLEGRDELRAWIEETNGSAPSEAAEPGPQP